MSAVSPVRVLLVHNSYRQPGGEDRVFATEARLLQERGHEVFTFTTRNPAEGTLAVVRLAGQTFWNHSAYRELRRLIDRVKPDVVHLHNTFPLISPAACYAARRAGVAVVQTLHNYRLLCPNALLFRDGRPCEDCLSKTVPWPAVLHACYRGSYAATVTSSGALAVHRAARTWWTQVDRYVALTEFERQKFIPGGLPADRIAVKPNLVFPDPGPGAGDGGYALFAGRLSAEKGIETLIAAWHLNPAMPLTIVGDGPLAPLVRRAVAENRAISWVGQKSHADVKELMGRATCVVVPSICYETFCLVGAEAFAKGTPVVASRSGALAELVDDGRTGRQFTPGDAGDLARQVAWMGGHPAEVARMRHEARAEYERRYSVDRNYEMLCRIYADALRCSRERRAAQA